MELETEFILHYCKVLTGESLADGSSENIIFVGLFLSLRMKIIALNFGVSNTEGKHKIRYKYTLA